MRVVNLTEAGRNLGKTLDRVVDDSDITIVTRRGDRRGQRAVVLMPRAKYEAMTARNLRDDAVKPDEC
jgi:prevent-host-death family protein